MKTQITLIIYNSNRKPHSQQYMTFRLLNTDNVIPYFSILIEQDVFLYCCLVYNEIMEILLGSNIME